MEERLLYVVYTYVDRRGTGIGTTLFENGEAPKNWEEIQSLEEKIKKQNKYKEIVLTNWFYLDSKF